MQISNASLSAQALGPTPRDSAPRVEAATQGATAPVAPTTAQAVETLRNVRLTGGLDERSGRVVTRVIDKANGEVVEQYPDEDALRVLAGIREMVGLVIDESV